jgi:hypothetical protein
MKTPQIEVSKCCRANPIEDFKDNPRDHHDPEPVYTCSKCKQECEVEEVCEECLGTGEVTVDEQVYLGEPHAAPIGTEKCRCRLTEETED